MGKPIMWNQSFKEFYPPYITSDGKYTYDCSNISVDVSWSTYLGLPVVEQHLQMTTVRRRGSTKVTTITDWRQQMMFDVSAATYKRRTTASTGGPLPNWPTSWSPMVDRIDVTRSLTSGVRLRKNMGLYDEFLPRLSAVERGDLAFEAAKNAKALDLNAIEFFAELPKLKESLKAILDLGRFRLNPKSLSKLYLSWKYGARLTIADAKEIALSVYEKAHAVSLSNGIKSCRSMLSDHRVLTAWPFTGLECDSKYHYKVYYRPIDHWITEGLNKMMTWEIFPSLSNVWDLVPYSFVVDWFLDVSQFLEYVDHSTFVSTLSVDSVTHSTKNTIVLDSERLNWVLDENLLGDGEPLLGQALLTYYVRSIKHTLDEPVPRFDAPESFDHWLELSAILISKR